MTTITDKQRQDAIIKARLLVAQSKNMVAVHRIKAGVETRPTLSGALYAVMKGLATNAETQKLLEDHA